VRWSGNGHLYDIRTDRNGVSWVQALLRAQAIGCGWYLATITSAAENEFVRRLAEQHRVGNGPWLGGFQTNGRDEPAGNWRWVTDEPFRYTNWAGGEPNNGLGNGQEAFLLMFGNGLGIWNDHNPFGSNSGVDLPTSFAVEFDKKRQAECRNQQ
jgi:hypothetical protein